MKQFRKIEKTVVRNTATKTNNLNGRNNKEQIKYEISGPEDNTVVSIPKWMLETKGSNPDDTMVFNGRTYLWFHDNHGRGMWVLRKPDKCYVKDTQVESITS